MWLLQKFLTSLSILEQYNLWRGTHPVIYKWDFLENIIHLTLWTVGGISVSVTFLLWFERPSQNLSIVHLEMFSVHSMSPLSNIHSILVYSSTFNLPLENKMIGKHSDPKVRGKEKYWFILQITECKWCERIRMFG